MDKNFILKESENMISINIKEMRKEKIYEGRVKMGHKGRGTIRLHNSNIGDQLYVIFPSYGKKEDKDGNLEIDEMLRKTVELGKDGKNIIDFNREYRGRKCIIIKRESLIKLEFAKWKIIYDGIVKKSFNGQGLIRVKDMFLGERAFVVFGESLNDSNENIMVSVNEIRNKGIHPDNDHTSRVLLSKDYVNCKCLVVLQEA